MSSNTYTGYGKNIEEALGAAADSAIQSWKPSFPDQIATVKFESLRLLYGGIVGHNGTHVAEVSLDFPKRNLKTVTGSKLSLKFDVLPSTIYANLMPPIRRPQPHKVGLLLSISNVGDLDYSGTSPDTAMVRFTILRGRTEIWRWPDVAGQVVTPIKIGPSETRTFSATWEIADVVDLVGADLHAGARFVSSGDSAMQKVTVSAVL
jgi:hypothetical protein